METIIKDYISDLKSICIGLQSYSVLEFENDGFRILIDSNYVIKFNKYVDSWNLDRNPTFNDLINDFLDFIKGKNIERKDLPMRFFESSRLGVTTNLFNGLKIQFIEDTLFGKQYKSKIYNIKVEDEKIVHFFY